MIALVKALQSDCTFDSDPLDPRHNATWRLAGSDHLSPFRSERGAFRGQP